MAFDLASNITPIIDGVVELMPSFLDLVIAMVPIVITLRDVSVPRIVLSRVKYRWVPAWLLRQGTWTYQVLRGHIGMWPRVPKYPSVA